MRLTAAEQRIVDGVEAGLVIRRTGHTQYALHRPNEAYKSEGPPFRAATLTSLYEKRPDLDPRFGKKKRRAVPSKDAVCKRCCDTGDVPNPADPYSLHVIPCPHCGGRLSR